MYRTHTCGELNSSDIGHSVTLSGWVQQSRDFGSMIFVDLRDRYGITQLVFNIERNTMLRDLARNLGREFVIQAKGIVAERSNKNTKISTGEIEVIVNDVEDLKVLNPSEVPPFTIIDETDGGDELRMKYRYLDLRREVVRRNLELRHRMAQETRKYLSKKKFMKLPFL